MIISDKQMADDILILQSFLKEGKYTTLHSAILCALLDLQDARRELSDLKEQTRLAAIEATQAERNRCERLAIDWGDRCAATLTGRVTSTLSEERALACYQVADEIKATPTGEDR